MSYRVELSCLLCIFTLFISGCGTHRWPNANAKPFVSWQTQRSKLLSLSHWRLQGTFSAMINKKTHMMHYIWDQKGSDCSIRISAPFYLYQLSFLKNHSGWTVSESGKPPVHASSLSVLMQHNLGFTLPVSLLNFWILGIPAPLAMESFQENNAHQLYNLVQSGWKITWTNHRSVHSGCGIYVVPQHIDIVGHQLKLHIAVRDWFLCG